MRHSNILTENDSPSSSPEYTTSEDEDASRESLGFSSIRLLDNDSSMGFVGGVPGQFPTNFAGIGHPQLSSSLPSTSNADAMPQDSQQLIQNNGNSNGRKRTFSTSESQPPASGNDKRTATKICRVCGDKAYSYNFNVITCESCKAFFRRNANKEKDIRCPFNDQCDINIVSRRFCQRCRLQKCFRVGMKKEWIMSEEARMEKKQRILDNRERRAAERKSDDHKLSNGNLAEDLAAAINNAAASAQIPVPVVQMQQLQPQQQQQIPPQQQQIPPQQQQQQPQAPPMLLPQSAFTAPAVVALPPPQSAPEVAQLAAAVAAVAHQNPVAAAAVVAASQLPAPAFQSIQNDAGQMATERALAASIVANASVPSASNPPQSLTAAAAAAHQQHQIVSQLVIQNQLQQQAAQAQMAVQAQVAAAQAQINHIQQQQHQAHQQLAAAVVAAAASTMVPSATAPTSVVTVPSLQPNHTTPSGATAMSQVQSNDPSSDLVAVPRDVLIKLVEQKIESEQQAQQQAGGIVPLKCQCHCQCGRYPAELLIVDKVMTDLLENSTKYNNAKPMGQLSPKIEQPTPPTLMSTTPPNFFAPQHNQHPTLSGPSGVFHPICTTVSGLPIPMEEDYVFKKHNNNSNLKLENKVLLDSKMDQSIVDPDCCLLSNGDIDLLNELQNANIIWDTVLDKKDHERQSKSSHSKLDLVNMADGAIRRLVKMSKRILYFRNLNYDDQMALIKYNHMGCLILRGALTYIESENIWSGPSQKSNYQISLEIMKESKFDLMQSSMNFYKSMTKEWRTNESINQILVAICLFDPSAASATLSYQADVRLHHLRYLSILKRKLFMLCGKNASQTCKEFEILMQNLRDLRELSYQAFKFVDEVRDCPVEPLVKELMLNVVPSSSTSSPST